MKENELIISFCHFCGNGLVLGAFTTKSCGKRYYHIECFELVKEGMKV